MEKIYRMAFLVGKKKMSKCQNCKHGCHCQNNSHKDDVGVCKCSDCKCKRTYKKQKDHATDMSFENEIKYDG